MRAKQSFGDMQSPAKIGTEIQICLRLTHYNPSNRFTTLIRHKHDLRDTVCDPFIRHMDYQTTANPG